VLDPAVGSANRYAAPGGPLLDVLLSRLDAVFHRMRVAGAAVAAYDRA
jgi:hypothetical protein